MANLLENLSETVRWHLLVNAAKKAADAEGYSMERVPGRGLSNIWNVTKDGETKVASIRTTRDRWIAFPPLERRKNPKTSRFTFSLLTTCVSASMRLTPHARKMGSL